MIAHVLKAAYATYERLLAEHELARELARTVLPVNYYTQWYWKVDLHNLLHFLALRIDPHAQYEIRVYAEAIAEVVKAWVPHTWAAFEDYRLGAFTLPPVSLLDAPKAEHKIDERELMDAARNLEEKCREFNVEGSVVQIHPGPVVTTFEFERRIRNGMYRDVSFLKATGDVNLGKVVFIDFFPSSVRPPRRETQPDGQ